jgi:hypothetical protein
MSLVRLYAFAAGVQSMAFVRDIERGYAVWAAFDIALCVLCLGYTFVLSKESHHD